MTMVQSFDALGAARDLREAGVDARQVEAFAQVVRQATVLPDTSTFATKSDLALLKSDLAAVESRLLIEIERAKSSAIVVILSGMALLSSATVAAIKLIH